jgi:zinc/manganese transport system permease protein
LHELNVGSHHAGDEHGAKSFMAYLFCTIAAGVFALLKSGKIKIPLEAIIGIAYAVAATGAVIILDKGAGGDVHIHDMLAGAILWVSWSQILRFFIVVLLVGAFHYFFRHKFIRLTQDYLSGNLSVSHPRLWDFLFYFSFGIVIVEAVSLGGILTIFAFLIIPASISALFSSRWSARIFIGLGVGGLATISGLYLSWMMDVPSSPTIILFLGICFLFSLAFRFFKKLNH